MWNQKLQETFYRRDGRAVECGGLENHCGETHPEFESQSLRSLSIQLIVYSFNLKSICDRIKKISPTNKNL